MLIVGLAAGAISGIIGTGASIMLLPVLVLEFGPKQAVPIMAIAAVMVNVAKMMSWWREVDWRATAAYAATGIPAAALGARTLLVLPSAAVDAALGLFFIAMVPGRRWLAARNVEQIRLWQLRPRRGGDRLPHRHRRLDRAAERSGLHRLWADERRLPSTEAASSLALYVAKVVTFHEFGALPPKSVAKGVIVGAALMAGSLAGKAVVLRLSIGAFQHLLDGLMLCSGLAMLWAAVAG